MSSASSSAPGKVPEWEWFAVKDKKTGSTYYANFHTQETSWTRPSGFSGQSIEEYYKIHGQAKEQQVSPPSCNWKAVKHSDSGRLYYYHVVTRQTTWQRPEEYQRWEDVQDILRLIRSKEKLKEYILSEEKEVPQCNWESVKDPSTGYTYYFHTKTRETTWDIPKEYEDEKELRSLIEEKKKFQGDSSRTEEEKDGDKDSSAKNVKENLTKSLKKSLTRRKKHRKSASVLEFAEYVTYTSKAGGGKSEKQIECIISFEKPTHSKLPLTDNYFKSRRVDEVTQFYNELLRGDIDKEMDGSRVDSSWTLWFNLEPYFMNEFENLSVLIEPLLIEAPFKNIQISVDNCNKALRLVHVLFSTKRNLDTLTISHSGKLISARESFEEIAKPLLVDNVCSTLKVDIPFSFCCGRSIDLSWRGERNKDFKWALNTPYLEMSEILDDAKKVMSNFCDFMGLGIFIDELGQIVLSYMYFPYVKSVD